MGAELTLTTSVFPSDEATREYFERLGRGADWRPLAAEPDAEDDDEIELDLSALEPLIAMPGLPTAWCPSPRSRARRSTRSIVGSCTDGSWEDMWAVGHAIRGKRWRPALSLVVFPGQRARSSR